MSFGILAFAALAATIIEPLPDLGEMHEGPKTLELTNVPTSRLPRFEKVD